MSDDLFGPEAPPASHGRCVDCEHLDSDPMADECSECGGDDIEAVIVLTEDELEEAQAEGWEPELEVEDAWSDRHRHYIFPQE